MTPQMGQAGALIALLLRDLGVIALCRLGASGLSARDFCRRGGLGRALWRRRHGRLGRSATRHGAAPSSRSPPPLPNAPLISLASGLVQAAIVWFFAMRRIGISAPPSAPASAPGSPVRRLRATACPSGCG